MLKGQAKTDYQREYMRTYMRERRAKVLTEGLNKEESGVLTPPLFRPRGKAKMGFEQPRQVGVLDGDGNEIPEY